LLSDTQIMLEVQHGRIELFDQLVNRHRSRMLRFAASKLLDGAAAEDVVQEAWLSIYAARHTYRPEFAVTTWVYTVLLNLCRRHARRAQRQRLTELPLDAVCDREASPLALLMAEERRELLHTLLDELPEAEADALRLRFFSGLMFEEIAAAMQSSVSGAKVRVRRGLERLAARLMDSTKPLTRGAGAPDGPDSG
jgi:RNA polymerase sigma-70 factor (ECF subfamily)